jgi:hypothetical protein
MQNQCNVLALAHDSDGVGTGDIWTAEVVEVAVSKVSGPTELAVPPRVIDMSSIEGIGDLQPCVTYIDGDPFRIGGSVNMFGNRFAKSGSYLDSTYNFTADFITTFAHAFSCDISVERFHGEIRHPAIGKYVINPEGDFGDSAGAVLANCVAFSAQQPPDPFTGNGPITPTWWGEDHGGNDNGPNNVFHCIFEGTAGYTEEEGNYPPEFVVNEPGIAVNQDQTDNLTGFEDHGGPVQVSNIDEFIGQTVICISPSKTVKGGAPGAWQTHNGYTGTKCTTDWFKVAPWGAGTNTSKGTHNSVPNYSF